MAAAVRLANCDVCDVNVAVRDKLTRHIKRDWECNCNVCKKKYE